VIPDIVSTCLRAEPERYAVAAGKFDAAVAEISLDAQARFDSLNGDWGIDSARWTGRGAGRAPWVTALMGAIKDAIGARFSA
jgi:hypothetical protein